MNFWFGLIFIFILWTIANALKKEAFKSRNGFLYFTADVILTVAFVVAYAMGKAA